MFLNYRPSQFYFRGTRSETLIYQAIFTEHMAKTLTEAPANMRNVKLLVLDSNRVYINELYTMFQVARNCQNPNSTTT